MPDLPAGRWAIVCLQCTRRYRSFARYLEHSALHDIGRTLLEAAQVTGTSGEGFFWRVGSARWALVAQLMTVQGEPRPASHEVSVSDASIHVLRVDDVNDTLAICDVDGVQPIVWVYPARRFLGPSGGMMGGPTGVCEGCRVLINRRDLPRLVKRVGRRVSIPPALHPLFEQMFQELIDNITGPGVEIGT